MLHSRGKKILAPRVGHLTRKEPLGNRLSKKFLIHIRWRSTKTKTKQEVFYTIKDTETRRLRK